jgi:hypothetical protein
MIINDNIKLEALAVSNLPSGGNIGTAANTVDQASMFTIAQTTINQAITLPTPTIASNHVAIVKNTGTASFQIHGANVKAGEIAILIFQNGAWSSSSNPSTGNIISSVSNALPTDVLQVAGLFEFSMAASTDVRIRSISGNRSIYLATESEYPGGSFMTSTAAPVALTSAFITADNNVHVAGERFTTTVQDINTNRIFKVTCWRFGAVTGNWSGWAEEIGLATNQIITAGTGIAINNGVISSTTVNTVANIIATTYTALTSDTSIRLTLANTQTLTLPTTGLAVGQKMEISNPTGYNKVISSITSLANTPTVFINSYEAFTVQWDGTTWIKMSSSGESIVERSKYIAAANWAVASLIIGNVEFSFNAANIGATTAVQARCVGSTGSFATSLNVTKDISGGLSTNDSVSNPAMTTAYLVLGSAAMAITTQYTKVTYRLQDRTSVTPANLGIYEIIAQNDGSTNISLTVKYIKGL